MDEKAELVRNWLEKARRDLGMAALVDDKRAEFLDAELADTAKTIYRAVLDVLPSEARPERQL